MGSSSINPFIEYRHHLDGHAFALDRGLSDDAYVALVAETDDRIRAVDGVGFVVTPLTEIDAGAEGTVLAKVETGAVGASHKARHLFGLILRDLITEATEASDTGASAGARAGRPDLAIASCGNAAIGAAVVARATERALRVFVPTTADPVVVGLLDALGADITQCPRQPGVAGDPCVIALDEAVEGGAEPFTVQGPRCPSVIDGCRTLGLELAAQLDQRGVEPASIYIQIGGGALATAVLDGLTRAWPDRTPPRLHPVQAQAAHPYVAGWDRIVDAVLGSQVRAGEGARGERSRRAAEALLAQAGEGGAVAVAQALARHEALMTPWPGTPESVASGILDDVTYDWLTVAAHQVVTGGWPILVEEATFTEAAALAAETISPRPDETGAAGLAGWLTHRRQRSANGPHADPAVVLLTGAAR